MLSLNFLITIFDLSIIIRLNGVLCYQVFFHKDTNTLHRFIGIRSEYLKPLWFQVFRSNTNNSDNHPVSRNYSSFIITIMSRHQHGSSWPSLITRLYHPSLPVDLQGYIPYRHRTVVYKFLLVVLPFFIQLKGSTGVYHLWVRPYFSNSVCMSVSSNLNSFRDGW